MKLIPVASRPDAARHLWDLLAERTPEQSISHRHMPTKAEHRAFVESHPYQYWALIDIAGEIVGACYLTRTNEIGIAIYKKHRGKGFGPEAVKLLMEYMGPREYLANVNPLNEASARMFKKLGFNICQHTYRLDHNADRRQTDQSKRAALHHSRNVG